MMSGKERIHYFDTIKGIMILMVVLGHMLDYITASSEISRSIFVFIYAVHMPMFFVISGYFHSNKNIANKVYFYLVMGLLTKFLIFITRRYVLGQEAGLSLLSEGGTPWFMYAMAAFILTAYLLRSVDIRVLFAFGIIIGCFAGYDSTLGDYLVLSRYFVFFPFYTLGLLLKNYADLEKLRKSKALRILSPVVIAGWCAVCFVFIDIVYRFRPYFTGRNAFGENIYQYGFAVRLFCYAASIVLCMAFLVAVPNGRNPLTVIGNRSLQVYFWHRPIVYILMHFGVHKICTGALGLTGFILVSIALGALLSLKIFSDPTEAIRKLCMKNAAEKEQLQ